MDRGAVVVDPPRRQNRDRWRMPRQPKSGSVVTLSIAKEQNEEVKVSFCDRMQRPSLVRPISSLSASAFAPCHSDTLQRCRLEIRNPFVLTQVIISLKYEWRNKNGRPTLRSMIDRKYFQVKNIVRSTATIVSYIRSLINSENGKIYFVNIKVTQK